MSRLINDTYLLAEIDEMMECAEGWYNPDRHEGYMAALEWMKNTINKTPTAYNFGETLKELMVLHDLVNMNQKLAVSQAIDIVKRGKRNE